MSTATATWQEPTTREDGKPLTLAEIAFTEVSLQTGAGAFVFLANVLPGTTNTLSQDLTPGNYTLRFIVVDKSVPALKGKAKDFPFVMPAVALTPPGLVSNVAVAVS